MSIFMHEHRVNVAAPYNNIPRLNKLKYFIYIYIYLYNIQTYRYKNNHNQSMLTLKIQAFFAKFGQTFRKTLPLDYKKGNKHSHRNTHALPMLVKDSLMKSKRGGDWKRINEYQRRSLKPYGKFLKSGFVFDKEKLPFYDIPDLTGFQLKPYVQFNAPKISQLLMKHQQTVNKQRLQKLA